MTDTPMKIALAVRHDLETWQKLNVAAFLTSGFATVEPSVVGEPYRDADDRTYLPLSGLPVRVFAGELAGLRRALNRAIERGLHIAVYTDDMFATMNDVDNRATVVGVATEDLVLAGFAVVGDAKQVDKAFDKLKLHP